MLRRAVPVLAVVLCSIVSLPSEVLAQTALTRAVIESIRNRVQLLVQDESPRSARVSDVLVPGNGVSTSRDSLAELRFNDGSLGRLGEQVVFWFTPGSRNFQLSNGTVLLLIPPGRGRTQIRTPNAAAGIQGSALFVRYIPETDTTIVGALTDSGIQISNRDGTQSQELKGGQIAVAVGDRLENIYDFDLTTFYETSELVRGLSPVDSLSTPDETIAPVRTEMRDAINSQVPLTDADVIENPEFVRRPNRSPQEIQEADEPPTATAPRTPTGSPNRPASVDDTTTPETPTPPVAGTGSTPPVSTPEPGTSPTPETPPSPGPGPEGPITPPVGTIDNGTGTPPTPPGTGGSGPSVPLPPGNSGGGVVNPDETPAVIGEPGGSTGNSGNGGNNGNNGNTGNSGGGVVNPDETPAVIGEPGGSTGNSGNGGNNGPSQPDNSGGGVVNPDETPAVVGEPGGNTGNNGPLPDTGVGEPGAGGPDHSPLPDNGPQPGPDLGGVGNEPPVVEPPVNEPPVVEPPVIEPPVIEPPVVEAPIIEPPVIEPPVIEPPVVEPPVIEPPVIEPPVVEPPVIESPLLDPTTTIRDEATPPLGAGSDVRNSGVGEILRDRVTDSRDNDNEPQNPGGPSGPPPGGDPDDDPDKPDPDPDRPGRDPDRDPDDNPGRDPDDNPGRDPDRDPDDNPGRDPDDNPGDGNGPPDNPPGQDPDTPGNGNGPPNEPPGSERRPENNPGNDAAEGRGFGDRVRSLGIRPDNR